MNAKIFCLLAGAALAWASTGGCPGWPEAKQETPATPASLPSPPINDDRWIGLLKNGESPCPEVYGWDDPQKLLAPGPSRQEAPSKNPIHPGQPAKPRSDELAHELGLDRFCVYTRNKGWEKPFPKTRSGLLAAEPDRIAVVPLSEGHGCSASDALGKAIQANLETHFLQQVGQVDLAPSQNPGVRLVFVDTQKDGEWPPASPSGSCHGYTMAHLAHQLVCGGSGPCPIQIATRLALGYNTPDPDSFSRDGGRLGSVLELAQAIADEVALWQSTEPGMKLVLNLSIGWDGELSKISAHLPTQVSQLETLDLAVYQEIRYATELGALVIAAAGNRRGGRPDSSSPVLPAAWELRSPSDPQLAPAAKPVYAVGGLDWQGMFISNSRHGGRPQRAAYADHAVVRIPGSQVAGVDEWTSILTGTSVSAAVVSSVAAAIWHLRPDLASATVMEWIDNSAQSLSHRPDFYNAGPSGPPFVRRVSLCRAVQRMCGPDGALCRPAVRDLRCPAWDHQPPDLSWLGLRPRVPHLSDPDSPMELLPDLNTPASGWTGPQPGDNPCSSCTILPDPPPRTYSLAMETSSSFDPVIESAVLVIDCGALHHSIRLDPPFSSSTRIPLELSLPRTPSNCTSSIDWAVRALGESRSVQSPVLIYPDSR